MGLGIDVLFLSSILLIVFALLFIFSKDLIAYGKLIFEVPGVSLFLPLLLVSWVALTFIDHIWFGLSWAQAGIVLFRSFLPALNLRTILLESGFIAFIALIPTILAFLTAKPFRPFRPPYWASIYLCIVLAVLISIPKVG